MLQLTSESSHYTLLGMAPNLGALHTVVFVSFYCSKVVPFTVQHCSDCQTAAQETMRHP